jgi:hypothetical protein
VDGYDYNAAEVMTLFLARHYPERTDHESGILRDYLSAHVTEYDRVSFSVRVGEGQTADPNAPAGVQRSIRFSSRKRIDFLGWAGNQPTIGELKERVTPAVLGQLRTYRQLFLEEQPDALEPRLIAIGRYSDSDTLRVLAAEGITVYLYDAPAGE